MLIFVAVFLCSLLSVSEAVCGMSEKDGLKGCLKQQGLPDNGLTPLYIRNNCDKRDQIASAAGCFRRVVTSCLFHGAFAQPLKQNVEYAVETICEAENINNDCLAEAMEDIYKVRNCYKKNVEMNQPAKKFNCEVVTETIKCVTADVRSCDQHTGDVLAKSFEANRRRLCEETAPF